MPALPSLFLRLSLLALSLNFMFLTPTQAQTLLTLEGLPGAHPVQKLSLQDLKALPQAELSTSTPWTKGVQTFRGVGLMTLLKHYGVEGGDVTAFAQNDFSSQISLDDPLNESLIIAYEKSGAPIPARGKGPLWIVLPFDSSPEHRTEARYGNSVWKLERLHLSPPAAP